MAQKGDFTPGSVRTVVTNKYNPETGEIESVKETVVTNAKQEIIVGTKKYTGEFKNVIEEEIPYKYTVVYDPEMKAGTYEEVTTGKAGERVTILTIKNSKVVGEPKVVETQPVDAVIKVGSKDFTGTFETKKTDFIEFETIYEVDSTMEPGTTKIVQEGQHGEIETIVTHAIVNGNVTKSEDGTPVQTKAAVNRIVKVGAAKSNGTHEYTNKIPYDVEVRVNPELKKGEHKVVQKGEVGEEKYTLTIVDSKVTNTSEPTTTKAAVKEIIEIGSEDFTGEVKHTEHFEIPFEVEVRYNDELPAGTSKEIQKGEKGSYDVEYKQAIKNGEAYGELSKTETNRKEAKKHIIEVGTKVETPENNYAKDVEVEIEYVYDEQKTRV